MADKSSKPRLPVLTVVPTKASRFDQFRFDFRWLPAVSGNSGKVIRAKTIPASSDDELEQNPRYPWKAKLKTHPS